MAETGLLLAFEAAVAGARHPDEAWRALETLTGSLVGYKLFTVMTVDLANQLARRAYTSHPVEYPVSGTKPIHHDAWFDIVHRQKRLFVANTIAEIAKVFPDHEKIAALGCASVVNLPVIIGGDLAATINMLHREHYYDESRVELIRRYLTRPAEQACFAARDA